LEEDDAYLGLEVDFAAFWRSVERGSSEPGFGNYPSSGTGGFTPGSASRIEIGQTTLDQFTTEPTTSEPTQDLVEFVQSTSGR